MNYIYYFKSTVNNYFFEISQPNPKRKKDTSYHIFALDGVRDYSSSFVPFENKVEMARGLASKAVKKVSRSGNRVSLWARKGKIHLRHFGNAVGRLVNYISATFKISEAPAAKKKSRKKKKKKKNSKKPKLELIPHMCGIDSYKSRKFLFLNPTYIDKKIVIPPYSNFNLPRVLVFDFKSKRRIKDSKEEHFFFEMLGKPGKRGSERDLGSEKTGSQVADSGREVKREAKWKLLRQDQLNRSLDDMVLVIKNNVTSPFIIPVKSGFLHTYI